MGELQKRIKKLSKTYPFFEEALESWLEEAKKEFPLREWIAETYEGKIKKQHVPTKEAVEWYEKWLGNSAEK